MTRQEAPEDGRDTRRSGWLPALALVVVVVVVGIVAVALLQGDGPTPPAGPRTASIGLILEDPDTYSDGSVVVSGRVDELLTERAVTIGSDLVDGVLLLVLPEDVTDPTGATVAIPARVGQTFVEGDVLQVTGEVRTLEVAAFEEDYSMVLNPELFGDLVGEPALVARDVSLTTLGAPQLVEPEPVSLDAIAGQPEDWAGRLVITEGAMGERIDDAAFLLVGATDTTDGATSIIVVAPPALMDSLSDAAAGAPVEVRGTVWEFDRELIEEQADLQLDAEVYADLQGLPSVIAEDVKAVE